MAEISSGILRNATPLTTARIKELEAEVLNQKSGFAYLDENSDLCFALPCAVDGIKELAWDNAYELTTNSGTFTKKAYKKTGLTTFELGTVFSKTSMDADWQEGDVPSVPTAPEPTPNITSILKFDYNNNTKSATVADYHQGTLPKVLVIPDKVICTANSHATTAGIVGDEYTITTIGNSAFAPWTAAADAVLESVYLPDSINLINGSAFNAQAKLNTINIGNGITAIRGAVFSGCSALTTFTYRGTVAQWNSINKGSSWSGSIPLSTYIQCLDGRIDLQGNVLEGSGQEFYNTAPAMLSFRSPEPLSEFNEVLVNGEVVDPSNYDLEEGSTIVKLSVDYLKTLPVGEYGIQVVSTNNAPTGTFTVSAPELNEHGFYYNQPYCANVPYLGGDTVVFIRADGTLDLTIIEEGRYYSQTCTYVMNNKGIVITDANGTSFNTSFSDDGNTAYVAELDATFALGNGLIAADNDYIYTYNYELGGYEVSAIDKTKASYGAIKTGINGIATVKIAEHAFYDNKNMTAIPVLPNSITAIGVGAFEKCSSLEYAEIPDSVTTVGAYAFNECTSLEGAVIGAGVIDTGYYIFARSNKLESLVYNGTLAQWQAVTKASPWYYDVSVSYLQCSDGNDSMPVIKY